MFKPTKAETEKVAKIVHRSFIHPMREDWKKLPKHAKEHYRFMARAILKSFKATIN